MCFQLHLTLYISIIQHNLPLCVSVHLLIALLSQLMQSAHACAKSGAHEILQRGPIIFASFSTCKDELSCMCIYQMFYMTFLQI